MVLRFTKQHSIAFAILLLAQAVLAASAAAQSGIERMRLREPTAFSALGVSIAEFGAVGDDRTDNSDAFARAVRYMNDQGGYVVLPRGIYRTAATLPPITCSGCGFVGTGAGMRYTTHNDGPAGSAHGTVIRLDAEAGDTITVDSSANGVVVRDIGFWPVRFRRVGVEVADHGLNTLLENLSFAYGYGAVAFRSGANGSTARRLRAFAMFGPGIVSMQGSSSELKDWAQGIVISDYVSYLPWPVAEPVNATTSSDWSKATAYARGAVTLANGFIWQAITGGRSASTGSGPVVPHYAFAGAPTSTGVPDGSVVWHMIGHAESAAIAVDSNVVDVVIEKAQLLTSYFGIVLRNSLNSGIVPQYIKIVDSLIDHTVGDCIRFSAGYQNNLRDTDLHHSALGRSITIERSYTGGLRVAGGHIWNNALDGILLPPVANTLVSIQNASIVGNGVAASNRYSGISVPAGATNFSLIGNQIGRDSASVAVQRFGVFIADGADDFVVMGNLTVGNGETGIGNDAGLSSRRVVVNNR